MAIDFYAWHDRTATNHKQMLDQYRAQGYSTTISLSVYGEVSAPRYASVVVRRPLALEERQFTGMTTAGFQQKFDEQAAQGWGPAIVTATGTATNPLFAAVFRLMKPVPYTRAGINATQLSDLNAQAVKQGTILQSVDAYGTTADTRYIAVWHPNPTGEAWLWRSTTPPGYRPLNLAITPSMGLMGVFGNSTNFPWVLRSNLTSAGYQSEFDRLVPQGMAPLRVAAQGTGTAARFAAIFATRE